MFSRLRTRLFAAVLLLPLVALATATSGVGLRCRTTGLVLTTCCCGDSDAADAPTAPVATLSPASCCDRVFRDLTPAPAELGGRPQALGAQPAAVIISAIEAPAGALARSAVAVRAEARATLGSPTVRLRLLSKSAFLI